jgi:hypothetical protein
MGGTLYGQSELLTTLSAHSFAIDVVRERDGLDHEYRSRRIYVVARRR